MLYIVLFLHQTTTFSLCLCKTGRLYIVLFLHQTTTVPKGISLYLRCISYYSYIKPQLAITGDSSVSVVYRTIPTSNHNLIMSLIVLSLLYIVLFLHQTTTGKITKIWFSMLYIVLFLHQTTTYNVDIADNQHITITFINKK